MMDTPSLLHHNYLQQMFGEVLTPSQRVSTAEPAPQRRYSNRAPLASAVTTVPAVPIHTLATIIPKIDAVFINAHFGDYMCIVEKKKDFKAKA